MKKLIRKLGVLGLIAFIMPIINVDATTASCEGGERHLQNYLFLDVNTPDSFVEYTKEDRSGNLEGYTTYGNFPYTFAEPDDKSTVKVVSVTENRITNNDQANRFWNLYTSVLAYARTNNGLTLYKDPNSYGNIFVSDVNPNFTTDTIILHSTWRRQDENGNTISDWPMFGFNETPETIQGQDSNLTQKMNVSVDGATYIGSGTEFSTLPNSVLGYVGNYNNLTNYFNDMVNGKYTTNSKWYNSGNDYNYIPLKINRTIDEDDFNQSGVIFGASYEGKDDKIVYQVFSEENPLKTNGELDTSKVENSYDAFLAYKDYELECGEENTDAEINACMIEKNTEKQYLYDIDSDSKDDIDFMRSVEYYWPFVLNVEYEVCPINSEQTPENGEKPVEPEKEWTLKYDANLAEGEDATLVTNMPNPNSKTAKVSEEITVDASVPSKKDNAFVKWCETRNGSGKCYNPGDKVKSLDGGPVTLFAQWGPTNTVDNPKQGVVSYIIGFSAVALIAGGVFLISKKKNLFKQI